MATPVTLRTLNDVNVFRKTVLVRVDYNVSVRGSRVVDSSRIEASLQTLRELSDKGAKILIVSHRGRPNGQVVPEESLRPIYDLLKTTYFADRTLSFCEDITAPSLPERLRALHPGDIMMCENIRFHGEEEHNDPDFSQTLAGLADFYVNDAFSASHRAHASIEGITHYIPSYAGRLLEHEIDQLNRYAAHPKPPVLAVVGGGKVSTKLELLYALVDQVDALIIGGGMATTFLYAKGQAVGTSLVERGMKDEALKILEHARATSCSLLLPVDVETIQRPGTGFETTCREVNAIPDDAMMVDIGPQTITLFQNAIKNAATIIWNGPMGLLVDNHGFDQGTKAIGQEIIDQTRLQQTISVIGGGDTIAVINKWGWTPDFSYVSMAGGAFLEWLEGKKLPGLIPLEK